MVRHSIAGGEYNARRADCEAGVKMLQQVLPNVTSLRDVTLEDLHRHGGRLSANGLKRARHVVSENARVLRAAAALESGELGEFGQLMAESHRSLKHDYEVSCAELDYMVELASAQEGVIGSRMTGGGFGGCTVSLVERDHAESFVASLQRAYHIATGIRPDAWICVASHGVHGVEGVA
jgi:galactokinase